MNTVTIENFEVVKAEQSVIAVSGQDSEPKVKMTKDQLRLAVREATEKERKQYQKKPVVESGLSSQKILNAFMSGQDGDAWLYRYFNLDKLRYDHAADQWYVWRGQYWEADDVEDVLFMFDEVINAYGHEADRQSCLNTEARKDNRKDDSDKHEKQAQKLRDRILSIHNIQRKVNVLKLARAGTGEGYLGLKGYEWDRDPWVLGCVNGVIDLRTGTLRDGIQGDYIQKICPTPYEGMDCDAPVWEKFLFEIFDGDQELIDYIQRIFGYSITGLRREHFIPILYGRGRNGKGTLLETIKEVLGEIAKPVQSEMLVSQGNIRSSSAPSPDLLDLRGRRIAWASETEDGGKFNAGKVKLLTGGDTIPARAMYGKRIITFEPTHTMFLLTNHKPRVTGDDDALWERIHLVPFPLSFVPDPKQPHHRKVDTTLPEKLKAESSGILAWLIRGCLEWQRLGLMPPDSVKAATSEYRSEEDILGQFLEERCDIRNSASVQSSVLHAAYKRWCENSGYMSMGMRNFGKSLGNRNFIKSKINGCFHYRGLELKVDDPFFERSDSDLGDII